MYYFNIINLVPASGSNFYFRISEDNGATFKAGASDYNQSAPSTRDDGAAGGATFCSTGQGQILLSSSSSSTASDGGVNGWVRLLAPSGTASKKSIMFHAAAQYASGFFSASGMGRYQGTTNAVNAVRFLFASGNITSGTISLYGIKKS